MTVSNQITTNKTQNINIYGNTCQLAVDVPIFDVDVDVNIDVEDRFQKSLLLTWSKVVELNNIRSDHEENLLGTDVLYSMKRSVAISICHKAERLTRNE